MRIPRYVNQGHKIVAGWDNEPTLRDWTAYSGADGQPFAPPYDRNGYTAGVIRRLNTGGIKRSGFPIARLTLPAITDGQIAYLASQFTVDGVTGNVTIAIHLPGAQGKNDVSNFNAVFNLDTDQLTTLTRRNDAYEDFVCEYVIVEVL
jgi:hypothetical protein